MLSRRAGRIAAVLMVGASATGCVRPASGQIVVPNIVGVDRDTAVATVTSVGLRYQVVVVRPAVQRCPIRPGTVVGQNPSGGTPALPWTVVTITSYSPEAGGAVSGPACVPPP